MLVHLTMKGKQSSGMPQATTKWRHQEARLAEAVRKDDTASQSPDSSAEHPNHDPRRWPTCAGFAVGEAVEEATKAQPLRLLPLLALHVLKVAKVLRGKQGSVRQRQGVHAPRDCANVPAGWAAHRRGGRQAAPDSLGAAICSYRCSLVSCREARSRGRRMSHRI